MEISLSRYVIWRLFTRDFTAQFRQKILGYFWAVIAPLFAIASFVFMNYTGILNPGKVPIPYPVFVFFGTSLWGIFIGTLGAVSQGLLVHADLVIRTDIPKISLAVAGLANMFYSILVNFLVLVLILLFLRVVPSWWALLYPLMIIPLVILGVGMGLLLAVIGAVARDVTGAVMTVLGLAMYITPVAYVTDFEKPILRLMVAWNPLTYLVDVGRNIFFLGKFEGLARYGIATLFCLAVLVLGIHGFYLIKDKVAERL